MKNIHIIPTDKPSKLYKSEFTRELEMTSKPFITIDDDSPNQHIYITSKDEIKEGEYGLSKLNEIIKFHSGYDYRYYAKIILTTDQDLIKDSVQAIDDEFLEWFVKNSSCEEVEIETFEVEDYVGFARHTSYPTFHDEYKIIIPK